jgi:small-conductance mechanosensitive channel
MHQSRDEVVQAIKEGLDEAGIEIPFPYRTLTFAEDLRIEQKSAESED